MWLRPKYSRGKKKAKGTKKPGFIPAPNDTVHISCFRRISSAISKTKKTQPNEQPKKHRATRLVGEAAIDLAATGPLNKQENMAFYSIAKRKLEEQGEVVSVHSPNGGSHPLKFMKLTTPRTATPSPRTTRRNNSKLDEAARILAGSKRTTNQVWIDWGKTKGASRAGLSLKSKLKTANDDLDFWVSTMSFSLYQLRTFISVSRTRFGWRFGQTIDNHRQGKTDRRSDTLYSTEPTVQEDGKSKVMHYKRVEDIGNMIAQKVSELKNGGLFRIWDLRGASYGAVVVSPVVVRNLCKIFCVIFKATFFNHVSPTPLILKYRLT